MTFHSILYEAPDDHGGVAEPDQPDFFTDLNLDQVVDAVTAGRQEYDLVPIFYAPLGSVGAIAYRHEVLRDLEGKAALDCIGRFAQEMRSMREHLSQAAKLRDRYQRESWFLDAVQIYCDAVGALAHDMRLLELRSRGFSSFRGYLDDYIAGGAFTALAAETKQLKDRLAGVTYCLLISGSRIKVSRYDDEVDYSADVTATFAKFKQGEVKEHRAKFSSWVDMNHVEAGVLHLVADLFPDVFAALDGYVDSHRGYLDDKIGSFDREVQFYVACLEFTGRLRAAGLASCYPQVVDRSKEVGAEDTFDVALANKLVPEGSPVVCNDFHLEREERIIVVSGPNQGGKTTFARTFGQLHYLAGLGLMVPGSHARLYLFDQMFTHFERGENLKGLSGKLQDDLFRIRTVLERATPDSIIIMNEIFTSTTLQDAIILSTKVLEQMMRLDCLGVCVTFVDELASLSASTVSMVSTIVPENPATRTYKIVRRPADGLAYANAIAEQYGLTYDRLKARIAP